MYQNGYASSNGSHAHENDEIRPTYALEHLVTFKLKTNSETSRPKEKLKTLMELDKNGGVWPIKMYICFSGQWLVIYDNEMKEIETFPGTLITDPTAFITEDPAEQYNNLLVFSVPGVSLGMTDMHIFQVCDVSAIHLVEDLKSLADGNIITMDRNKTPIQIPKPNKGHHVTKDQYGIAVAAAEVAAERNAQDQEQLLRDTQVINHCFEDIERFVSRLQFAAEALRELERRTHEHSAHGEGLLRNRSQPPSQSEFEDIFAKHKLAFIYTHRLKNQFQDPSEPLHNLFVSLLAIYNICNDVYVDARVAENVEEPLLRKETIAFLKNTCNHEELDLWHSLGPNWLKSKDQFPDPKPSYHPVFYDEWSPDWVVDEEVPYAASPQIMGMKQMMPMTNGSPSLGNNATWLARLKSRNVKIAEVLYNKVASNDRELNVSKGEHLEIIDDSRNWWKARNSNGNIGYVPHTILAPYNFENNYNNYGDTDSIGSSIRDSEPDRDLVKRKTLAVYAPTEQELQRSQLNRNSVPRSISMPNVPVPPPMPPPSEPGTPSGTLSRNMAIAAGITTMRPRNDRDYENDAMHRFSSTINDEMKMTLVERERRRDMEILVTPQIYISQSSSSHEVEEWLRGKGFSDVIVKKLRGLTGAELFSLTPHKIESYFGQKDSRRLISQIVLQKNISEYKTVRSSELSAKLAKARQKVDKDNFQPDEVF